MAAKEELKTEIDEILDRLKRTQEKRIRTTKDTTFNEKTKTYVHRIHEAPGSKKEIATTWGDEILDYGFTLIPNILLDNCQDLGIHDRHLMLIGMLLRFGQGKRHAYPAIDTLAKRMQSTRKTVQRTIRELKKMGYLETYKRYIKPENSNPRRTSNVYDLGGLLKRLRGIVKEKRGPTYY